MTRSEERLFLATGTESILDAMSIHAKEFAEFCSEDWWYDKTSNLWENLYNEEIMSTEELYTLFNNQNK